MCASLSDEYYFRTEFIEILVFYVDKFRRVCYAVRAYLGILQLCNCDVFCMNEETAHAISLFGKIS